MVFHIETIKPSAASRDGSFICRVELNGNITNDNSGEFEFIMSIFIKGGIKKIILDIGGLKEIDSMGISSLIGMAKKLKKENGEVIITRYKDQVLTLLKPIGIERLVKIFGNTTEGINYLESLQF